MRLKRLLHDVTLIQRSRATELAEVSAELASLVAFVQGRVDGGMVPMNKLKVAVAALAYLRDPFDASYEQHRHLGLRDDCRRIRAAASAVRAVS
jgi:hypothetical protein